MRFFKRVMDSDTKRDNGIYRDQFEYEKRPHHPSACGVASTHHSQYIRVPCSIIGHPIKAFHPLIDCHTHGTMCVIVIGHLFHLIAMRFKSL